MQEGATAEGLQGGKVDYPCQIHWSLCTAAGHRVSLGPTR